MVAVMNDLEKNCYASSQFLVGPAASFHKIIEVNACSYPRVSQCYYYSQTLSLNAIRRAR